MNRYDNDCRSAVKVTASSERDCGQFTVKQKQCLTLNHESRLILSGELIFKKMLLRKYTKELRKRIIFICIFMKEEFRKFLKRKISIVLMPLTLE